MDCVEVGRQAHNLAKKLWPINRSITGSGVRETLIELRSHLPDLKFFEVPTGTKVFDWVVPQEWSVNDAWLNDPNGSRICDIREHNLHLVGYSVGFDGLVSKAELEKHLFSIPEKPSAIPYITSYYEKYWGFCLEHSKRKQLKAGDYRVYIDANHFDGALTYGELIIPGESKQEILLSTYVCHPSMANNELSGPCVLTFIAKWLSELKRRRYTYRVIFVPETIGSITYLSKNLDTLKERVVAGFNITCIGDDRAYSFLPSRDGSTLSDRVAKHVLRHIDENFIKYGWNDRGSDERQFCAPHVNLPIASIMRSKYLCYEEYHTSLDDLENVVTITGLAGGYEAIRLALEAIERNICPKVNVFCEPQMGKYGLYPSISDKRNYENTTLMMDLVSYSDGNTPLIEIAEKCDVPIWKLYNILDQLIRKEIIASN